MAPSRLPWPLVGGLVAIVLASHALTAFNWGFGPARGLVLFILIVATLGFAGPARPVQIERSVDVAVAALLAAGAAMWIAVACQSIAEVRSSGVIPLDEGQTSYRAARAGLKGENPYGTGALIDFHAFLEHTPARVEAGLATDQPQDELYAALTRYDRTLDAVARVALLPPAKPGAPGGVETQVTGYKYGPLLLLASLPAAAFEAPSAVMAMNALAALAMVATLGAVVFARTNDARLARFAVAALLFDETILDSFVRLSATDVYPLGFCALAALAHLKGKDRLAAVALAVGFGFKTFPCALLAPMLLSRGRLAPAAIFVSLATAIYLPVAALDVMGLLHNVFLWPLHMPSDSTSWLHFAPPFLASLVRPLAVAGLGWIWARYLTGREPSLPRTLALVALVALISNGAFHNNYFAWASIWLIVAWTERFALQREPIRSGAQVRLAAA